VGGVDGHDRAAARGWPAASVAPSPEDATDLIVARALAPPSGVLAGRPAQVRRLVHLGEVSHRWDFEFFPLRDASGVLGVLGKVTSPPAETNRSTPLIESLANLAAGLRTRYDF
jgi:hypothetical protein